MANQTRASLLWKICRQKTQIFPCHLLFNVYVENHDATRSIISYSSNSSLSVTVLISGLSSYYTSMSAVISEILCLDSREHMVESQKQLDLCPFSSELFNLHVC